MENLDFQLTYSVHPLGGNQEAATKARRLMRNINGWEAVENIETTLVGKLSIKSYLTLDEKRKSAESYVEDVVKRELDNNNVYNDVNVYMSLMVDELGEHIKFSV